MAELVTQTVVCYRMVAGLDSSSSFCVGCCDTGDARLFD